jgi:PucR family transcriptional regulator, purine catabolism regulatory protein
MRVREALALPSLATAAVVAGRGGLDRAVRWAHVVDMPQPGPWLEPDQLLLTTGYAWPTDAAAQSEQIRELGGRRLAAIGLAVPGYIDAFTPAARAAADGLDLPLLEIPWDVPFARVTEELHRALLSAQRDTIERSESIHRALTRSAAEGTSLQELAQQLGTLIARSVTIEDPDGKLLAYHDGGDPQDDARRETVRAAQSPQRVVQALERRGVWERIRASVEPVRVAALAELGVGARVVCPIRIAGDLAGLVWILEGSAPLSDLDHRAAEHAALVAALLIAHQRELAQLESRLGYASFLSLLEAPDTSAPEALERARLGGFDPDAPCRVGVAIVAEALPLSRDAVLRRDRLAERLRHALARSGVVRPMLGPLLNHIPFLLPVAVAPQELGAALDDPAVRFVFGRAHTGADGVRASYREARSLEPYGGAEHVVVYEEVLLPRVLAGDAGARQALLERLLGPLERRRGGAVLREALLAYASEGFRFRKTAQRLGIHPNTLRYRLARAREATALDFDDPEVQFRLQLASRIADMCNEHREPREN